MILNAKKQYTQLCHRTTSTANISCFTRFQPSPAHGISSVKSQDVNGALFKSSYQQSIIKNIKNI